MKIRHLTTKNKTAASRPINTTESRPSGAVDSEVDAQRYLKINGNNDKNHGKFPPQEQARGKQGRQPREANAGDKRGGQKGNEKRIDFWEIRNVYVFFGE